MAQLSMEPVAWEFVWTKSLDHCIQQGLSQPGSAAWERTRLDTELELNTASASNTNGGEMEEMGYSTEVTYSHSDQDYDYFHILHGKLRIYFNQIWGDCWKTNYDCSGEFQFNYLNLNEVYFIKAIFKKNGTCRLSNSSRTADHMHWCWPRKWIRDREREKGNYEKRFHTVISTGFTCNAFLNSEENKLKITYLK